MPYCVTILRASSVARSMSFEAPVVTSPKTSSSAAWPPSAEGQRVLELRLGVEVAVLRAAAGGCSRPSCRGR